MRDMGYRVLVIDDDALMQFDKLVADEIISKTISSGDELSPEECRNLSYGVFHDFQMFLEERGFILKVDECMLDSELIVFSGNILNEVIYYEGTLKFGLYLTINECTNIVNGNKLFVLTSFSIK